MDAIHDRVRERFQEEIAAGVVEIRRSDSADAAIRFPDRFFDWVYVDGNHVYDAVKADLDLFRPKIKPGGIVAGDDYGTEGWWEGGVTRAVDEAAASGLYEVVRLGPQFVLRVPPS